MRVLLETLDISVSHSCAWICSAITILFACGGNVLYVSAFGGFSLNVISWASSARVLVWKFPVLLITIGIISTSSLPLLCCRMACLSGS